MRGSAGAAPPADGGCLRAERRVGERLQRLVQVRELGGDPQQRLLRVEATVERAQLVADPVEPFEQGVELPVVQRSGAGVPSGEILGRGLVSSARL